MAGDNVQFWLDDPNTKWANVLAFKRVLSAAENGLAILRTFGAILCMASIASCGTNRPDVSEIPSDSLCDHFRRLVKDVSRQGVKLECVSGASYTTLGTIGQKGKNRSVATLGFQCLDDEGEFEDVFSPETRPATGTQTKRISGVVEGTSINFLGWMVDYSGPVDEYDITLVVTDLQFKFLHDTGQRLFEYATTRAEPNNKAARCIRNYCDRNDAIFVQTVLMGKPTFVFSARTNSPGTVAISLPFGDYPALQIAGGTRPEQTKTVSFNQQIPMFFSYQDLQGALKFPDNVCTRPLQRRASSGGDEKKQTLRQSYEYREFLSRNEEALKTASAAARKEEVVWRIGVKPKGAAKRSEYVVDDGAGWLRSYSDSGLCGKASGRAWKLIRQYWRVKSNKTLADHIKSVFSNAKRPDHGLAFIAGARGIGKSHIVKKLYSDGALRNKFGIFNQRTVRPRSLLYAGATFDLESIAEIDGAHGKKKSSERYSSRR